MMGEPQDIRKKIVQILDEMVSPPTRIITFYPDTKDYADQILSVETEDYRLAVVKKKAELPVVKWTSSPGSTPSVNFMIANAFRRAYEEAGFVQEEKDV